MIISQRTQNNILIFKYKPKYYDVRSSNLELSIFKRDASVNNDRPICLEH